MGEMYEDGEEIGKKGWVGFNGYIVCFAERYADSEQYFVMRSVCVSTDGFMIF